MVAVAWSMACGDSTGPSPPYPLTQVSADWVTPEVARLIGQDGRFLDISATPDLPDELDKNAILTLLAAFNRTIPRSVGNVRGNIEATHGTSIDFDNLVPCGRALYMQASVEPLQTDGDTFSARFLARLFQGGLNAKWSVPYCDRGGGFVLVHSMSSRTRLFVGDDGLVNADSLEGIGEGSTTAGIPRGGPLPFRTPERAVEMVFGATGARVSTTPQVVMSSFLLPGFPGMTRGFFWRMRTERPVPGRLGISGPPIEAQEFYATVSFGVQDGVALDTTKVYVAGQDIPAPWWEKLEVPANPDRTETVVDSVLIVPKWAMRLYEFIPDR